MRPHTCPVLDIKEGMRPKRTSPRCHHAPIRALQIADMTVYHIWKSSM